MCQHEVVCEEREGRDPGWGPGLGRKGTDAPHGGRAPEAGAWRDSIVTPALLHFWVTAMTAGK